MTQTLQAYEDIIKARRDVDNATPLSGKNLRQSIMCDIPLNKSGSHGRVSKRSLCDTESDGAQDSDHAMEDVNADTGPARPFAPFTDG